MKLVRVYGGDDMDEIGQIQLHGKTVVVNPSERTAMQRISTSPVYDHSNGQLVHLLEDPDRFLEEVDELTVRVVVHRRKLGKIFYRGLDAVRSP
jgi:hypothetical protein